MYAKREAGAIVGVSRWPGPDFPEQIADDHADVLAFKARNAPKTPDEVIDDKTARDPLWTGLVGFLAKQFGLTEAELIAQLKAEK